MTPGLRIAINGSILTKKRVGIDRYTRGILDHMHSVCSSGAEAADGVLLFAVEHLVQHSHFRIVPLPQGLCPEYGFRANLRRLLWNQVELPRLLLQHQATLFYSPVPEGMINPPIPQVVTVHDLLPLKVPGAGSRLRYYYAIVLPRVLRASAAIITVSDNTRRDLLDWLGSKISVPIHVIPPGVDDAFGPAAPERIYSISSKYGLRAYLLCLGDPRPYKNTRGVILAFSRSVYRRELQLVIVGNLGERAKKELLGLASSLRVENQVRFIGYVEDDELASLFSGAQAFVFPSLYEGFGLPPLEAMRCGCPVIVSNSSSLPEVCGDAAYYFNPVSEDSIAHAIDAVIGDNQLRERLKQKGIIRASNFSWESTCRKLHELLQSVAA